MKINVRENKRLIEYDKNNAQGYVPLLVICLSHFNPIAAEEYSENIPPVKYDQIDAEELENSSLNFRVPKAVHDEISIVPVDDKLVDRKKNKKKKKKKKRVAKNFNPMVVPDPERWLPRKDRSNFKRRKGVKKSVRGAHQGADISLFAFLLLSPSSLYFLFLFSITMMNILVDYFILLFI